MRKELDYLERAENSLAKQKPLIENRTEYRAVVGYSNSGDRIERGIYYFCEANNGQTKKQILKQDTLSDLVPLRGVVIENGKIVKSFGLGKLHEEVSDQAVRDFFGAFNRCDKYKEVSRS